MEAHLRPLTAGDEPFLWTALYHALYVPPGADPLPEDVVSHPDLARYVAGWMRRPGDLGFIAESGGEPVGAAWVRRWRGSDRGYGFVDEATPELSMAVVPGHRGRGIGSSLLRRLLSAASAHSDAVSLSVSAENPARRLYERFGFVPVDAGAGGAVTMVRRAAPTGAGGHPLP